MALTAACINELLKEKSPDLNCFYDGVFGLDSAKQVCGSNGRKYCAMSLYDYTGCVTAYAPDDVPLLLDGTSIVTVTLALDLGRDKRPVPVIYQGEPANDSLRSPLELLPGHLMPQAKYLERVLKLVDALHVTPYRQFVEAVFADRDFAIDFSSLPAGKTCHHTEQGGLLRHSLEVAELTLAVIEKSSGNRVLAEAAVVVALFHDVGKVLLSRPDGYRIPCSYRHHERLIEYALANQLSWLRQSHENEYNALWATIQAYRERDYYSFPLAGLVQANDAVSARADAESHACLSDEGKCWVPGCGNKPIWLPNSALAEREAHYQLSGLHGQHFELVSAGGIEN